VFIVLFYLIFAPYELKYIGKISFVLGVGLCLSLVFLGSNKEVGGKLLFLGPARLPLLIFYIILLVSVFLSPNSYNSQSVFFDRYIVYLFYFVIASFLVYDSNRNIFIFAGFIILSSFIFSLGGSRDYFYYGFLGHNKALAERVWSVFGRRISYYGFPLYLTYFLPFIMFIFVSARNKLLKALFFIPLLLLVLCLFWNASRAAWVATGMSILFISIVSRLKKVLILSAAILIITIPLLIIFKSPFPEMQFRAKTVFVPEEWSFRLPLYKQAVSIFRDHPVFGVGIGNYQFAVKEDKYRLPSSYPISEELNLHAHNTYLEIAAEAGIIGLLAFISIFIIFFGNAFRVSRDMGRYFSKEEQGIFLGLLAAVLATLIFASSSTIIIVGVNNPVYFWIIFGMSAGMLARYESKIKGAL
jgi:O-antigen ligase